MSTYEGEHTIFGLLSQAMSLNTTIVVTSFNSIAVERDGLDIPSILDLVPEKYLIPRRSVKVTEMKMIPIPTRST
jgi:hypothetical protein